MPAAIHLHPAATALVILVGFPAAILVPLLLAYYVLPFETEGATVELIVNPGARLGNTDAAQGWTNTWEQALAVARDWLAKMVRDGFGADIELVTTEPTEPEDGRWRFTYRHKVTGTTATLDTHGINDLDAYERQHLFAPKVYWNGSSCSDPELANFAAPGYVQTYRLTTPEERRG